MARVKGYIQYARRFLNLPGHQTHAHIIASVQPPGPRDKDFYALTFAVTDCDQTINLDFSIGPYGGMKNSMHKLDVLVRTVEEFRGGLKEAYRRRWGEPYRG